MFQNRTFLTVVTLMFGIIEEEEEENEKRQKLVRKKQQEAQGEKVKA